LKRLLFPLLAILVVLLAATGCEYLPEELTESLGGATSQPPTAYIDSISPEEAAIGETITFDGHGTDTDGTVVAYRWRSSIDGDLSAKTSFETASLSEGEHVIYLKVQDNNDSWSEEVRSTVIIKGASGDAPDINSFEADPGSVVPGVSSTLSWDVSNATSVTIDQGIGDVALSGTKMVIPAANTQYVLTASNEAGSVSAAVQVVVLSGLPVINYFTANPWSVTSGGSLTLNWDVTNATIVAIDNGVGNVDFAGNVSVSPSADTSYTLTATNAIGWSSVTIEVVVDAD